MTSKTNTILIKTLLLLRTDAIQIKIEKVNSITEDVRGVGEDGTKDSQVSSGNPGVADDFVLLPLHELGPARPVEPHPEPGAAGLLLRLCQRAGTCGCD